MPLESVYITCNTIASQWMPVRISIYFQSLRKLSSKSGDGETSYIHLLPCGHLNITETLIIWTAAKHPAKINYKRLTEINSRYDGRLSLLKTLTCSLVGVHSKGSWMQFKWLKKDKIVNNCYYCIKHWWEREGEGMGVKKVAALISKL